MFNSSKIIIILIFLIILILYIFISYHYELKMHYKKINKEGFTINKLKLTSKQFMQPINQEFKKEWKDIIIKYINEFNQINLVARNVNTHKELIDKYSKFCLLPISKDNINSINNMLSNKLIGDNKIIKLIKELLPKIRIVKCSKEMEIGFPHTHKNIIVFSQDYFVNPSITTFIHECIHIDQRINPNKYNDMYSKWGFIKYPISDIQGNDFNANIIPQSRINPDGIDINWLWISPNKNAYWLGAVFTSNNPKSLSSVENRIYKIENVNDGYNTDKKIGKYNGSSELIHNNSEFKSVFGNIINNNYHPNEIAAELAVNYYLKSTKK
jgi:sulfur relay (sulfurtransferase) DsrC/TusE family protein